MAVSGPLLFLTVPWIGLQCVIVVFHDHTHLLFRPSDHDKCVYRFSPKHVSAVHSYASFLLLFYDLCLVSPS